ncbi:MAG: TRAP transporter small permease subunit [Pelovirga sp.]|jgi:C4-dicarboxylate transporter, DctQ subunit
MVKNLFKKIDRGLLFVEEWALFIAVCAALLAAMANVILRKSGTDFNIFWSDEVVRKVIYFSTYIGAVTAIRSRSLIRIDALPQLFPVLKRSLTLLSHLVVLFFAAVMVYLGGKMTLMMYADPFARTSTLQIPEWYFYAVLPLMGAMMFVRTLMVMVEDWRDAPDVTGGN